MRVIRIKSINKKSIIGLLSVHMLCLSFVNAFGYILPTLYLLYNQKMGILDYMVKSIFIDLISTIMFSIILLKRKRLCSFKIMIPIILALIGLIFHDHCSLIKIIDDS